jgi:hypothetical protein
MWILLVDFGAWACRPGVSGAVARMLSVGDRGQWRAAASTALGVAAGTRSVMTTVVGGVAARQST